MHTKRICSEFKYKMGSKAPCKPSSFIKGKVLFTTLPNPWIILNCGLSANVNCGFLATKTTERIMVNTFQAIKTTISSKFFFKKPL